MLSPKRTKFRKKQRRMKRTLGGKTTRRNNLAFGEYGLMAMDNHLITNRQIEAARIAMTRKMKRGGKVWIRLFPDIPYTQKPAETRMGKGKGNPEYWVAAVKPGVVMFEIAGVASDLAEDALRLASSKLPVKTRVVARRW